MIGLLSAVSGCATLSHPLPKCDGYAKRPLNRSMWDWEASKAGVDKQQFSLADGSEAALAFAERPAEPTIETAAFASFDEDGSHTACRAG
ncbi:type IV secretion system protein VirB7 [Mesorhizobium sp. B2-3-12]|nr:type IV secretion system protein VirB7 [Mesorhizobium sp. B2-3-12]